MLLCRERGRIDGNHPLQQFHRLRMNAAVAGGNDASAVVRAAVFPCGHDAAGAFDDGNERQHVVRLELGLDDEIDVSGREHAIGVAIAAIARQPHRLLDASETAPVGFVHEKRAGGEHDRIAERRARARLQNPLAGWAAIARTGPVAGKVLAGERLMHHAVDRLAAPGERDQRAPHRHAADEGFGAVDRVEDPDVFGIRPLSGEFLADDAVSGECFLDQRPHGGLGGAVGGGDRIEAAGANSCSRRTARCERTAGWSRPKRRRVHPRRLRNRSPSSNQPRPSSSEE